MLKHRSPILEHQNVDTWSLSDFFMENAKNSSNFAPLFDRETTATLEAMVDLGLELGNKRFLGHEAAWGEAIFFEISLI